MEETKKKAFGYIRISSLKQINNESPETQKSSILAYAEGHNIEIIDWFFDEAKSGKNADRPEIKRLLSEAARRKDIDHVVVYSMQRAGREVFSYMMQIKMALGTLGITVRSSLEVIDETPMGQFNEIFSVLMAQFDNQTKVKYTVDNMTALALQGYWQHPPIVGYEKHRVLNEIGKHRPTLKPSSSAPKVKEVLERFSEGNISKAELTRFAISIGLKSRNNKKISEDSINRMLKSPVYAGFVTDSFTKNELVKGVHRAIISIDTYETNQILLNLKNFNQQIPKPKDNSDFPLKGTLMCPSCKRPMYASSPKSGSGVKVGRYDCFRSSCVGKVKSIKASTIHDSFEELLSYLQPSKEVLSLFKDVLKYEAAAGVKTLNKRIKQFNKQLDSIADERLNVLKKFTAGELTASEKLELSLDLESRKIDIEEQLAESVAVRNASEINIDLAISVMDKVNEQWGLGDLYLRRRLQELLFPEGIYFNADNLSFGTSNISHLYRYVGNKKDSENFSKSFLVAGVGFEPTTLWL